VLVHVDGLLLLQSDASLPKHSHYIIIIIITTIINPFKRKNWSETKMKG
jgi:hypothetical protein